MVKTSKTTSVIDKASSTSAAKENIPNHKASLVSVSKPGKERSSGPSLPSRKVLGELNTAQVQARDAFYGRQENQDNASIPTQRTRVQPRRQTRSSVLVRDAIQPSTTGASNAAAAKEGSIVADTTEAVPVTSDRRQALRKVAMTQADGLNRCGTALVAACDGHSAISRLHNSVTKAHGVKKRLHTSSIVKSSLASSGLLHFKLI